MSSSSRSIAAARSRRAGETQPPVSGGRPGISIASQSSFVPQQQFQQMPSQSNNTNARVSKSSSQQSRSQQAPVNPPSNGLPFTKLSISDAIGLITIRLGRVEQFVIDYENGDGNNHSSIPDNSKIIDNSVLTTMLNRLDSLEKRDSSTGNSSSISNEQISKIEKDLKETKDLLSHFLFKFELFSKETSERFSDLEGAITEIEKGMTIPEEITNDVIVDENSNNGDVDFNNVDEVNTNL
jgi:archaellum component FlaC